MNRFNQALIIMVVIVFVMAGIGMVFGILAWVDTNEPQRVEDPATNRNLGSITERASIGRHTYGLETARVSQWGEGAKLSVGSFCSFGNNCHIYLGGNHRTDWVSTFPFGHRDQDIFTKGAKDGQIATNGDVIIGNDVWVGNDVTIMSGIHIGDGAVIAARSHVVKNVEPYTIVGGNPARFIRLRFSESQIQRLLQVKWWEWDDEKINAHLPWILSSDIDAFLDQRSDEQR